MINRSNLRSFGKVFFSVKSKNGILRLTRRSDLSGGSFYFVRTCPVCEVGYQLPAFWEHYKNGSCEKYSKNVEARRRISKMICGVGK